MKPGDAIVLRNLHWTYWHAKAVRANTWLKVNGDTIATQGQLAKLLPLQHIDPQSTDIIDHGAKPRRQLLDAG